MEKIPFENLPSTDTPISAENLNQLQINAENAINEVNNKLNGIKGYSDGGLNSVSITSTHGYGCVLVISAMFTCVLQLNGDNIIIIDIYGTHGEMSATINDNVVTLSGLYNWDHYIFIGSNAISEIAKVN